ncbi:MAG: hypothetical protein FWD63_05815, partial [Propionibacteriaceae bacterium]|nr:hypothetical protein [Propionibacteriaceae bacterium]
SIGKGTVLTPGNAQNIMNGYSYVLIMAIGMLFVIIMGHIDLAPGSVAAVVGICMALSIRNGSTWHLVIGIPLGVIVGAACGVAVGRRMHPRVGRLMSVLIGIGAGLVIGVVVAVGFSLLIAKFGIPWWGGVLVGLIVGALIGAWQGSWLAFVGVPGFITTLAGQILFRGLDQWLAKGDNVAVPKQIQFIGSGYLPQWGPTWGSATGLNNSTIVLGVVAAGFIVYSTLRNRTRLKNIGSAVQPMWAVIVRMVVIVAAITYFTYLFANGRPGTSFPVTGCILVVLVLIYNFMSNRTPLGRSIYAVGGNRFASELTGISNRKVYFIGMFNMSLLAAVAGIMFVGRSQSTGLADGVGWELDAIAAVFVGGAAVTGGVGTVTGAVIGGLFMAVLNNGLTLLSIGSDMTQMIKGLVLLLAVAFDLYSKAQGRPSIIGALLRGLHMGRGDPAVADSAKDTQDLGKSTSSTNAAEPQEIAGTAWPAPPVGVSASTTPPGSTPGQPER